MANEDRINRIKRLEKIARIKELESQSNLPQTEESSISSALLKGAQKGATFGFADEIAGLAGALGGKVGGDKRPFKDIYQEAKGEAQSEEKKIAEESPIAFNLAQVGGGLLLPGFGAGKGIASLAKVGAVQGALQGAGEGEGLKGTVEEAVKGGALGGLLGGGLGVAGKAASSLVKGADKASKSLARTATGASGEAARKTLKEGTEEYLLNKGIIGVGDTVESIAQKAAVEQEKAAGVMGTLIKSAEEQGVASRVSDLVGSVASQIKNLKPDASKAAVIQQLESIKQNIIAAANGDLNAMVPPSLLEKTKSGFQGKANYDVPGLDEAQKIVANIYRNEGEQLIAKALPEQLSAYQQAKNEFGLLAPVIESAEKKASQINQAQGLGLLDITSSGAGMAALGPVGAIAGPVIQRQIRSRGTATGAALLSKIPRSIEGIKQILPNLAQNNPNLAQTLQSIVQLPANKAEKVIAPIITQLSDQFEDSEYPSEFEGKLYSEEDKAAYSARIKEELSPIERAKAQSALNKDGTITRPQAPAQVSAPQVEAPQRKPITIEDMSANIKQRQY